MANLADPRRSSRPTIAAPSLWALVALLAVTLPLVAACAQTEPTAARPTRTAAPAWTATLQARTAVPSPARPDASATTDQGSKEIDSLPQISEVPAVYLDKVESTPDLTQTDPGLGLVDGGRRSCASVSVTNSLAWLADHGYPDLVLRDEDGQCSHALTAQKLDRIFGIASAGGILPPALVERLAVYLETRGRSTTDYDLWYEGWFHTEDGAVRTPDLDAIKKEITGDAAIWLLVGFYHFDGKADTYSLISHHYVTVVGYGAGALGEANPDVLIVHDPAPRSGAGVAHNHVQTEALGTGTLMVGPGSWMAPYYPQLPSSAAGYRRLGGELAFNPEADVAILDAAVYLRMTGSRMDFRFHRNDDGERGPDG